MDNQNKYALQKTIREDNWRKLTLLLLTKGPLARTRIAKMLGVSLTAASNLAAQMIDEGMLEWTSGSSKNRTNSVGRPAEKLALSPTYAMIPVVCVKRGLLIITLLDFTLKPLARSEVPYSPPKPINAPENQSDSLPTIDTYEFTSLISKEVLKHLSSNRHIKRTLPLQISIPGNFNYENGLFMASPLKMSISATFPSELSKQTNIPVKLANDSDSLAYNERMFLPNETSFIFVNYHFGLGAGVFQQGVHFKSSEQRAVELGHISIDYQGLNCACGSKGCLERYIGFDRIINVAVDKKIVDGQQRRISDIAELYLRGDTRVREIMDDAAQKLALGLSNLMAIFVTDRIIVGGGIEIFGNEFLSSLSEYMSSSPVRYSVRQTPVIYARNDSTDETRGCAMMFLETSWEPGISEIQMESQVS